MRYAVVALMLLLGTVAMAGHQPWYMGQKGSSGVASGTPSLDATYLSAATTSLTIASIASPSTVVACIHQCDYGFVTNLTIGGTAGTWVGGSGRVNGGTIYGGNATEANWTNSPGQLWGSACWSRANVSGSNVVVAATGTFSCGWISAFVFTGVSSIGGPQGFAVVTQNSEWSGSVTTTTNGSILAWAIMGIPTTYGTTGKASNTVLQSAGGSSADTAQIGRYAGNVNAGTYTVGTTETDDSFQLMFLTAIEAKP